MARLVNISRGGYYDNVIENLSQVESELQTWLETMLQNVSPARRAMVLSRIAREMRRRNTGRVKNQTNTDGSPYKARSRRGRNKGPMFKKLGTLMQIQTMRDVAIVGYPAGFRSFLVGIHQFGDTVPVNKHGQMYAFPVRKLLGISDDDREYFMQMVEDMTNP